MMKKGGWVLEGGSPGLGMLIPASDTVLSLCRQARPPMGLAFLRPLSRFVALQHGYFPQVQSGGHQGTREGSGESI